MRAALGFAVALLISSTPAWAAAQDDVVPQSVWNKNAGGSGSHLQSLLECPASVGSFQLSRLITFDGFGLDVGCDYRDNAGSDITLYLTERHDRTLAFDFEDAKTSLVTVAPEARPVAADEQIPSIANGLWLSAMYTKQNGALRSGVWMTDYSGWTFMFRATYETGKAEAVAVALRELAAHAGQSALPHLQACSKSPAPERGHARAIDDKQQLMTISLASMVGGAADSVSPGHSAHPPPAIWCAERGIKVGDTPLLLWRNVAAGSPPADRITVMSVGPPPSFESVADPSTNIIMSEMGHAPGSTPMVSGVMFQVMSTDGDQASVYVFYDGRPDGDTLAKLVSDIMAHKARPIAGFNTKTRTITIAQ